MQDVAECLGGQPFSSYSFSTRESKANTRRAHNTFLGPEYLGAWPHGLRLQLSFAQAALLWRCAALFKDGLIEQSGFKQLFANLVTITIQEAKEVQESYGLQQMIVASGAIQNNDMVNIQEFVTYRHVHAGSDPPLEDESWDHELFRQYVESRHQDQEVYSATQSPQDKAPILCPREASIIVLTAVLACRTPNPQGRSLLGPW